MSDQCTVQRNITVGVGRLELLIFFTRLDHQTPDPLDLFDVLGLELTCLRRAQSGVEAEQRHPEVLGLEFFAFLGLFGSQARKQGVQLRAMPAYPGFISPLFHWLLARR